MAFFKRSPKTPLRGNARGEVEGYRSGLEDAVALQLKNAGVDAAYEQTTIKYPVPSKTARYTPDFILPNGIVIETKGRFVTADRTKHRLVKEAFPDLDIRFVFSNPKSKIGKKSKTTYADWCERLDIPYAAKLIPEDWLKERPNRLSLDTLRLLRE